MNRVIIAFPDLQSQGTELARLLRAHLVPMGWHRFPDGESLVTIESNLVGTDVIVLAGLRSPDTAALALRFAAETARELGARTVGLVAPYLPYMRQDKRFHAGEAVSAPIFARFLEQSVDWLVTVDPHLHRNPSLDALFEIPARNVAAAPAMADWLQANVPNAILIGPDNESGQWVGDIAARARMPFQVLTKTRESDLAVRISLPDPLAAHGLTPVVVDDIVSSGHTMIETLKHLADLRLAPAICLVTHAVFAEDAYERLIAAGALRVVSTDTIPHAACNAIAMAPLMASACEELLARP